MDFSKILKADWVANSGNPKGLLVVTAFRIAHLFSGFRSGAWVLLWVLCLPYLILYRVCIEWVLGIELPQKTKIGPGLVLWHGQGLVINDCSVIGSNVQLRHNVTIGNREFYGPCPVIEDDVDIGAGAFILGPIRIGKGAKIGAASVVLKDIPAGAVAVGNPARIIEKRDAPSPDSSSCY
jgi:serine acetyltransferase